MYVLLQQGLIWQSILCPGVWLARQESGAVFQAVGHGMHIILLPLRGPNTRMESPRSEVIRTGARAKISVPKLETPALHQTGPDP